MNKIELIAPAGSFEALKAAVNNGADAVYLGGSNFSARAFATNFDHDEMLEAVKFAHLRDAKIYVTLNTLLNDIELDKALNEAAYYYKIGVDALIIQDLGLYYRLKTLFPDFRLHASTQMHIHNLEGVKTAKAMGFAKAVIARESDLDFIQEACKQGIDIECFVHGAICVSYSGQCLLSALSKHRSANKGMCAQCCRLKYELYDITENKTIKTDTDYLLSPKDMFLLEDIPELIKAGVNSLKIEGRMKSPAYVALVTRCYREAIDAYYCGQNYILDNDTLNKLKLVFNRGFANDYLYDKENLFHNQRPNHMGLKIGEVIKTNNNEVFIKLTADLKQFDGIRIISKFEDYGQICNMIKKNGKLIDRGDKGEIVSLKIKGKVNKGDIVLKTLDYELEKALNDSTEKKIPLSLNIKIKDLASITIVSECQNDVFENSYQLKMDLAKNNPLNNDTLFKQFAKTDDHPYELKEINSDIIDVFLPISKLNEIRRKFYDDLDTHRLGFVDRKEYQMKLNYANVLNDNNDYLIESLNNDGDINKESKSPVINLNGSYKKVISDIGGILKEGDDKIAYYTLNVSNSYAYEFLYRLGFNRIILSTELNEFAINELINRFFVRNNKKIEPYVLIYGHRSLMYIRRNPFKDYISDHEYLLKDGFNEYLIKINCEYTEIIEKEPFIQELPHSCKPFILVNTKNDPKPIELLNKCQTVK